MKYIQYLWMCCIGLCLFACTEADELKTTEGKTGFLVSLKEETVGVEARTIPKDLPAPMKTDFTIRILNARTCEEVKNVQCTGDNQLIDVGVGIYNVVAEYGDGSAVSLDAPYYKGVVENQRVNDGKATLVTVNCKVANALLSISYDESNLKFTDVYEEGYYIKVVANGKPVVIKDIEKSAYFPAGASFDVYFCAVKKGETEEKEIKLNVEYNTLNPADHLTLFLSPEPEKYEVPLSITKMEIQQLSINETIPMGWLPKPKVTATGFDSNNTLAFVETEQKQAALNLNLSSALQDIKFKFDFQDEQFASSLQKNKEYLLSNAEDKQAMETALGITLPSVGDKPESIDLSGLVAKLQTNAGEPTTNTIEVDVQANNRWSSEDTEAHRVYTLTCNKPEFSIAVQPGNVWTKTFTIDEPVITAGNADVLNEKLVYQYKEKNAGDDAWQTCSDGLEQVFAEHPANKEYEVRAFYREGIVSNVVDIILEIPAQLPNSDMEDWYSEDVGGTIRSYYPWASNETSFWNTNNDYTTRYRIWGSIAGYNCFPAVSYVSGRNGGGKAAELRNTASGRYNTSSIFGHNEHDYNKVAGELFIGDITVNEESYEISTKGKDFNSRPTALQFYYKYDPYNGNDTWKVHFELLDENRETIISKEVTSSEVKDDYGDIPMSVEFDYEEGKTYAKCKYIYVVFSSTINTGSSLPYGNVTYYLLENGESLKYSNVYVGSILTIDDISLVYDK